MASITTKPNGYRQVQFYNAAGKRKTIRLGKISKRFAESVKFRIEDLLVAIQTGNSISPTTAQWISDLSDGLLAKFARAGLVPDRQTATIGAFIAGYIAKRKDTKPGTVKNLRQVEKALVAFYGADRPLRLVTVGEAKDFRLHLLSRGLAENTVRRRCGRAKQFFKAAVDCGLIAENPFAGVPSAVQANASRYYFVSREEAEKVLDACPDNEWRLIFALARFGGFRTPSETLSLRWTDIDWDRARIRVPSPKTEHLMNGESRIMPLFPELRPFLELAWNEAETGDSFVIRRYRDTNLNLRSRLLDIIWAAGLKEWPKLFQNLRSTRETELAEVFPLHVVCAWLGNSQPIAQKHYLQVTDEHFKRATQTKLSRIRPSEPTAAKSAAKSAATGADGERQADAPRQVFSRNTDCT